MLGFEALIINKFSTSQINNLIDNGATLISLVPSMLKRLINDRQGQPFPKTLRGIITSLLRWPTGHKDRNIIKETNIIADGNNKNKQQRNWLIWLRNVLSSEACKQGKY